MPDVLIPGHGTILYHGTIVVSPAVPTYTAIAQVSEIDGPQVTTDTIEVSHLLSTTREFRPKLPDAGEINFKLYVDTSHASYQLLAADAVAPKVRPWRISYPTDPATLYDFEGFVNKLAYEGINNENFQSASCTIKISGVATLPGMTEE